MKVSNAQRAIWMVLITSLAAPFFASLVEVALSLASPLADLLLPPRHEKPLGEVAAGAFIWSAMPATFAALGLSPYVLQSGTYGWLHAAVAGVLAFTAATLIWPFSAGQSLPFLAFLAGVVAITMRAILIRGGILKP
ncbi:MAG: hypothetical protein ACKVP4_12725 [Hyphomicrobium sp.]